MVKLLLFLFGLGMVGLALSYALSITNLLSGMIFTFAQTEMQLVSVERTEEYSTCIPLEPQHGTAAVRETFTLKSSWNKRELCYIHNAITCTNLTVQHF